MRKILVVLLISFISISCKKSETTMDNYVINGEAPGIYNGVRVYLKSIDNSGRQIAKDSAIVFDEKFVFNGAVDIPELWYLTINSVNGSFPLIVENKSLEITVKKDDLLESEVSGSIANTNYKNYVLELKNANEKKQKLMRESAMTFDLAEIEKLNTEIKNQNDKLEKIPFQYIKENKDNILSLIITENLIKSNPMVFDPIFESFDLIDNSLKSTLYGQNLSNQIESIKIQLEQITKLDIGKKAPEFTAPKADGQLLALNDIKGKVTIIDFWASWCGPCRRENPNVVNVYNKYHDKGLEIIGVSLDRPNQKDKWLKAIEDDKLTWHHVSNLQYFNDPIAQLYNIKSIPATYILDSNGTIVAKNLRGPALEAKIAELLN